MFEIDAKSGFWSLQCECGAKIIITGKAIMKANVIKCLECNW
jgi:hypothetical protein